MTRPSSRTTGALGPIDHAQAMRRLELRELGAKSLYELIANAPGRRDLAPEARQPLGGDRRSLLTDPPL
jgi:hypothetical protein